MHVAQLSVFNGFGEALVSGGVRPRQSHREHLWTAEVNTVPLLWGIWFEWVAVVKLDRIQKICKIAFLYSQKFHNYKGMYCVVKADGV